MMLEGVDVADVGEVLAEIGLDGWLLYDFHGINPVAKRMLGGGGMATRRLFVLLPATGEPVAVAHRIELQGLEGFPGKILPYASWQELHRHLGSVVGGKRLAMETSPLDAVPYLDWVPAGVIGLIEQLGGEVTTSAHLVSRFAARWSPRELADHQRAAETLADIARTTLAETVTQAGVAREAAVQRRVLDAFERAGLETNHPPIVGFGLNAANPHYEPHEGSDLILASDQVVLLDLWAGPTLQTPFADQTWMAFSGSEPPDEVVTVWRAVRDARDAVLDCLDGAVREGRRATGAELDDAARNVIRERGFGDAFVHRTGHSIDQDLHGSGPHLDNFETNDIREIIPGVGFSVEPGVYLEGRFGVRSEINVYFGDEGAVPTPKERQVDLIVA